MQTTSVHYLNSLGPKSKRFSPELSLAPLKIYRASAAFANRDLVSCGPSDVVAGTAPGKVDAVPDKSCDSGGVLPSACLAHLAAQRFRSHKQFSPRFETNDELSGC